MVAGWAIGGGHVLRNLWLTIAADNARFGQTGPKVGSFDGGYGASYLARIISRKSPRNLVHLSPIRCAAGLGHGLGERCRSLKLEETTLQLCSEILPPCPALPEICI